MTDQVIIPRERPRLYSCPLRPTEVAYCLYMPVSVPGKRFLPLGDRRDLNFVAPAFRLIEAIEANSQDEDLLYQRYAYLTVKRMYVGPTVTPNRPGWHSDGYGTDDINYIWYDCLPTLMIDREFTVSADHLVSLDQFDQIAEPDVENHYTIEPQTLIRLTPNIVHRVQLATEVMMRTFVKITLSKNRFNLEGNSTNPMVKPWATYPRELVRNDPHRAQLDFHTEDPATSNKEST